MNETEFCPACDGDRSEPLGLLGDALHLRCRHCGCLWHVEVDELEHAA